MTRRALSALLPISLLAPLCLASSSCSTPAKGAASVAHAAAGAADDVEVPWKDGPMAFDDVPEKLRGRYMKEIVLPAMKPIFQKIDAEKFQKFGCAACHGKDARERHFKMPNPSLPKLSMSTHFDKDKAAHPETFDAMVHEVEPEMARLLGEKPFDPATGKGFGCLECHMSADEPAAPAPAPAAPAPAAPAPAAAP